MLSVISCRCQLSEPGSLRGMMEDSVSRSLGHDEQGCGPWALGASSLTSASVSGQNLYVHVLCRLQHPRLCAGFAIDMNAGYLVYRDVHRRLVCS